MPLPPPRPSLLWASCLGPGPSLTDDPVLGSLQVLDEEVGGVPGEPRHRQIQASVLQQPLPAGHALLWAPISKCVECGQAAQLPEL